MKTTVTANVVGMKYHGFTPTEALRLLHMRPSLAREPHNSHDTNAIAVTVKGDTIGHIDRRTAAIIAPLLDSGATYEIEIGEPVGQSISAKITITQDLQRVPTPNICATHTIGIYAIWGGDDVYIGQSKDVQNRISQHWDQLHRGIHQNPQLRQLWRELGSSRFSAKVVELAPKFKRSLELARWLHSRECHWIDAFGGLRKIVNADFPQPVLDETAKRELQLERDEAGPDLQAMERKCSDLAQHHEKICTALNEMSSVVSKVERFWGIFNSDKTETEAEQARRRIPLLENEARKVIDKRIALQGKLGDLKRHLFIRD